MLLHGADRFEPIVSRWRTSLVGATLFNTMSDVTGIAIAIVITPFIVSKVGLAAFGFWSIVTAILEYVVLADSGLPKVTLRHVALAFDEENTDRLREAVATTLLYLLAVAIVITALAGCGLVVVPAAIGRSLPSDWRITGFLAVVGLALTTLASAFAAVPRGRGRWDLDSAVQTCSQLAGGVATVVLLALGWRLVALGLSAVVAGAVLLIGYAGLAANFGALGVKGFRPRRDLLRQLRRQGAALQVVAFVGATNAQADRLMLLAFAPLSFIGAYALGSRVAVVIRGLPLNAFGPLMTRFAVQSGDDTETRDLYLRSLRFMARYLVPALVAVSCICYPLVLAWLGARYTISATGAVVLGLGYAINISTGPGTSLAIGHGRAELDRNYNLVGLALNVSLSATLGLIVGPWGVVGATAIGLALSSIWLVAEVDRAFAINDRWETFRTTEVARTWGGALALGVLAVAVTYGLGPSSRIVNLAVAAGFSCLSGAWIGRRLFSLRTAADIRAALLE